MGAATPPASPTPTSAHDVAREAPPAASWGDEHDQPPRTLMALHVLGLAALAAGEPAAASAELARRRWREPGSWVPASRLPPRAPRCHRGGTLAGDVASCEQLVGRARRARPRRSALPWVDAAAARGHGVAAGRGRRLGGGPAGARRPRLRCARLPPRRRQGAAPARPGPAPKRPARRRGAPSWPTPGPGSSTWAPSRGRPRPPPNSPGSCPARPSGELTATESRIAELVVARPAQPGDRRRAVRQRGDGRVPPHPDLPEARRALAHRTGSPLR